MYTTTQLILKVILKNIKAFLQSLIVKYKQYFEQLPITELINKYIESELIQKTTNFESDIFVSSEIIPQAIKTERNELATLSHKQELKKYPNIFAETVNPDHLTVKQASEFLNLAEQTIYGYTHRKQIPFYKPHKKLYFLKTELEEWLRQGKQGIKTTTQIQIKRRKRN